MRRSAARQTSGFAIVTVLAMAVCCLGATLPSTACAETPFSAPDRTIVEIGESVYIAPGEVCDTVVAVGGAVTVAGTVRHAVVAMGGGVELLPGATVGALMTPDDVAVLTIGGTLTMAKGATLVGRSLDLPSAVGEVVGTAVVAPFGQPPHGWVLAIWGGWTLFMVLAALAAAAVLPRQVTHVRNRLRARFWPSTGWGFITAFVLVPLSCAGLALTIVGILVLVPWAAVIVPLLALFGLVSAATLVGGGLLHALGSRRDSLVGAAVIGTGLLTLLQLIPVLGAVVLAVATVVGMGATWLVIADWWRESRTGRTAVGGSPGNTGEATSSSLGSCGHTNAPADAAPNLPAVPA